MKASTTLTTLQVQIYNTGGSWDTIRTGEWTHTTDTWFDTWDTSSISTYMSAGGTVRLRIRGCTGGSFTLYHDTVRLRLTMAGSAPVANFTASPTSGTAPLTVNFTDGSSQTPTSWSWNFGDSSTSTSQNPSHQYTSANTYTVSLTATNAYGSDGETKTDYITVNVPAPVADFSGTPTTGEAPLTANFTDASTNSPTSWSWDFGDSSTSTSQNPSHQYTDTGNYTVSLTATNATGSDGETKTNYITVNAPAPVADFSGTPTSGTVPLTVNFTDASINSPTAWSWNFGDSNTSTSQNPSHQYTSAGTYTVVLTATNATGSDDETKTNYITVHPPAPVADFTGIPNSGTAPLTVSFTDTSTNSPTSWSWSFGDSTTSAAQHPTHQYASTGTYTVSLTATNATGSDGETKTDYITVSVAAPVANFYGTPTSGTAPLTVNFTDTSTNSPTSWSWNFGDGNTSTSQNPSHQYNSADSFTVSLTASNAGGSDVETKPNYIYVTVSGGNEVTVYPDTFAPQGDCSTVSGSLSDLETDNDTYMVVDSDSSDHFYGARYTADTNYAPDQVIGITIEYQAKRSLSTTPQGGNVFVRRSNGYWGFQENWLPGTTDSDWTWSTTDVSSWMSSDGIIGFELCGCPDGSSDYTISSDVMRFKLELAGSAPVANFSASPTSGTAPLTVSFTDTSTNTPTSWSWDFGDSNTSTSQNPSHEYGSTGNYTVSLTATNASGSDGETKTNYITVNAPAPVADFSADTTSGTAPLTVNFTDTSINTPTSWSWNFGDSNTSTSQNPSHEYTSAGTYTVSLTATNASGSDDETKTDYITVSSAQSSIFSDGFESSLSWSTSGDVTWYTGAPKIGTHSVRLRYTGSIQKTISTVGYENITVSFYLGAGSLDNSNENVQCLWYDGSAWTLLKQINNGDPEEDYGLHAFSFSLPSGADDNSDFALRFKINGSGTGDYAYVDNVVVEGDPATYVYPTSKTRRCDWSPSGGLSDVQTSNDVYFSFYSDDDYGGYDWYFDTEYTAAQLSKIEVELELKTSRSDTPNLGVNIWNYSISDWTIIRTAAPWSTTDDWIEWETSNVSNYMDNDGVVRVLIGGCPANSNDWALYHDVVRLRLTMAE